jgi:cysteinyl-tRNA synthetase
MVTRFAAATSSLSPGEAARPGAVEALLQVRTRARDAGRWGDADAIRQALRLLAVELHDTPDGTVWEPAAEAGEG